jgi:hypothetical protein
MYIWGDICENCCCTRCLLSTLISLQKTEHQLESNSVTSWMPSPWEASLHCATLKNTGPFLPASWLQSCMFETVEGIGEHHTKGVAPLSPPIKWSSATHGQTEHLPPVKLKNINSKL